MTDMKLTVHLNQRGQNELLDAAYRDLGRAEFRAELIFTVLCLAGVVLIGWLA